ncbi:MAG: DUF4469 domain-containing protein [Treponemataceae bacterium]|nr:DUF4469 domain-containing protein [Treponemataceae bacterium]
MNDKSNDLKENVNVTIHSIPFAENEGFYAKVQRNTAYIGNILDKVLEKKCLLDRDELLYAAGRISEAVLSLLAEGKAVDVLELGILYPKPEGGMGMASPGIGDIPAMKPAFTSSEKTVAVMRRLAVSADVTKDNIPSICGVYDMRTRSDGALLSAGYSVRIKGQRLKVAGVSAETGVFLAPCDEQGTYASDITQWVHISVDDLIDNSAGQLLFNVPPETTAGTYRLLIRTAYGSGNRVNKKVRTGLFDSVVLVA